MRWLAAVTWIERVLKEGGKKADEIEVVFGEGISISADLKKGNVNIAIRSVDSGIGIRTISKGRIGSSSSNDPRRWRECLDAALASGDLATPQPWGGFMVSGTDPGPDTLSFDPGMAVGPESAPRPPFSHA
jgi:PmbA protein